MLGGFDRDCAVRAVTSYFVDVTGLQVVGEEWTSKSGYNCNWKAGRGERECGDCEVPKAKECTLNRGVT